MISTTRAPRTACDGGDHLAAMLDARALDGDLAQRVSPFGLDRVDRQIEPPARVIAAVTFPSAPPGFCGSATRRVSENCADGVATEA